MVYDAVRPHRAAGSPAASYKGASELNLSVGDTVKVSRTFDDGWGLGTKESTGETGYFPLSCLVTDGKVAF
ncbi:hypothetical protein DFJ73DRAFT_846272 [Zopfochytrium polystomum]|nr:hypothetical protein DFJ73DRAFT_846272 [Zopfochytrium polystomum]